jgi:hypothetical protein
LTSNKAAGASFFSVSGNTTLSMFAPSNGKAEGPQYAGYAHWGPQQWAANRHFSYTSLSGDLNGDCVLSDIWLG